MVVLSTVLAEDPLGCRNFFGVIVCYVFTRLGTLMVATSIVWVEHSIGVRIFFIV